MFVLRHNQYDRHHPNLLIVLCYVVEEVIIQSATSAHTRCNRYILIILTLELKAIKRFICVCVFFILKVQLIH
uniref:Uncharacterized protein n=1 Tax=Pararge aegeria TaxID=116150 RepID=S4PD17_9NEOP